MRKKKYTLRYYGTLFLSAFKICRLFNYTHTHTHIYICIYIYIYIYI